MNGSTLLGTATLNASGVATLTITSLAVGTYSLTAQYSGNAIFLSSTSAAVSVTVSAQATTTSLTASPNPVTAGQTLTLTATVQGSGSIHAVRHGQLPERLHAAGNGYPEFLRRRHAVHHFAGCRNYSLTAQYTGNATSSPALRLPFR